MSRRLLILLLAVQGLSGLAGGLGLVADPTGAAVGLPPELLERAPIDNYFVPGLVLLLALGVGPCLAAYAVWRRQPGAFATALLVGLALVVWIVVQIGIIGYQTSPPLQLVYGGLGVAIGALAVLSARRRPGSGSIEGEGT